MSTNCNTTFFKKENKKEFSQFIEKDSYCIEYSVTLLICGCLNNVFINTNFVDPPPPSTREEVGLVVFNLASVTIYILDVCMMLLLIIKCQNF